MDKENDLPLGQREVTSDYEFTDEEVGMIEEHGLTVEKVREHLKETGKKSLETAIGSLMSSQGAEGDD